MKPVASLVNQRPWGVKFLWNLRVSELRMATISFEVNLLLIGLDGSGGGRYRMDAGLCIAPNLVDYITRVTNIL